MYIPTSPAFYAFLQFGISLKCMKIMAHVSVYNRIFGQLDNFAFIWPIICSIYLINSNIEEKLSNKSVMTCFNFSLSFANVFFLRDHLQIFRFH